MKPRPPFARVYRRDRDAWLHLSLALVELASGERLRAVVSKGGDIRLVADECGNLILASGTRRWRLYCQRAIRAAGLEHGEVLRLVGSTASGALVLRREEETRAGSPLVAPQGVGNPAQTECSNTKSDPLPPYGKERGR